MEFFLNKWFHFGHHGAESPIFSSSSMEKFLPGGFGSCPESSPSFIKIGSDTSSSSRIENESSDKTAKIPIIIPDTTIPIITALFTSYFRKISL